jgi:hypothetical protein
MTKVGDYDLTGVLDDDERISSALPDFQGRIWFVSKTGKVRIVGVTGGLVALRDG